MINAERKIFFFALVVVSGFIFLPDFPPMVDVPQHVAQATALKAILQGNFLWSDFTETNYFIPYWGSIGILCLLNFIFPIQTATNILLVASFLSFVLCFSFLRRKAGAPEVLDWLLIPAFFGFAYEWGFLPFIVASSLIGCWFYYINMKFAQRLDARFAIYVFVLGGALLFAHLLAFCFFALASVVHLLLSKRSWKISELIYMTIPWIGLSVLFIILFIGANPLAKYSVLPTEFALWKPIMEKFLLFPRYSLSSGLQYIAQCSIFIAMVCSPFLMGYRLSRNITSYSMLIAFFIIWFGFPNYAVRTFFIQERFHLFFIPAYIMCFEHGSASLQHMRIRMASGLLFISALGAMYWPLYNLYFFRQESSDFMGLIEDLPKGKRALSLIYNTNSGSVKTSHVFVHFPVWYQAMKDGWVDYNFAWTSPQIRFKVDRVPEFPPGIAEWRPGMVLSTISNCDIYDLIFMKVDLANAEKDLEKSIEQTACSGHRFYRNGGNWYVFKKQE
ncbi:MAG: hypothetical protein LBS40_08600 [Burkholderiales bacterium]|jgi:hypothetical protein|nr:hypothetical protein [Burkholderiales bacterium]